MKWYSMRIEHSMVPALLAIGFLDVLANSLFAVATNHGLLALVAVAGAQYSAVTVLLAKPVPPQETENLQVTLQPGEYKVYCPVGSHENKGMKMTLKVTAKQGG